MIRSLYNLTQRINYHIVNMPSKKDFDLRSVSPILNQYSGNDWYDYKIKNSPMKTTQCMNNYMKIPIVFMDLNKDEDELKDIYGMYLVVWNPFCETSIHNHPEGGCLMKVLDGKITQYKFRNSEIMTEQEDLNIGDISFINDNIGLHRISNDTMRYAYSLHLYSPSLNEAQLKTSHFMPNQ
jgi:hypothetical protein